MRFSSTDDQQLFAETVRDLFDAECQPSVVRAAWAGERSRKLWSQLADMGVLALLASEDQGGLAMSALDLHHLLVESGRCALPDPLVDTAAIAVPVLADAGHDLLDDVLSGTTSVGVGFEADLVVRTDVDLHLLQHGDQWHLVTKDQMTRTHERSVDMSRSLASIEWSPTQESVVNSSFTSDEVFNRAITGLGAQLLGLADYLLYETVEYVKDREQFGRPIGVNQALKHKLSDCLVALDFARPVVARAAYSISTNDPDVNVHASMAKCFAAEAAELTAKHALQCHGAIAYTTEHDLHMWLKRVWALSRQWGDAQAHRRRVGSTLLKR